MIRRLLSSIALVLPLSVLAAQPAAPAVEARSFILIDGQSNQTLVAGNADMRIEPASLTKLMTAYLTFKSLREGQLKLDQMLTVSREAQSREGSRMFVDARVPVSVDDLIKGVIVQSGNDACVVLAEALAGSEQGFVQLMNREAQRLGLANTHYLDSTGLTGEGQYTTAEDLAKLAQAIIRDFPEYYPIYSMKSFSYNNIKQDNRNLLLYRDAEVDGLKTGHTSTAGYNLVSSTKRDGRRLIAVVTGTTSMEARARESAKLLNWGTSVWETPRLFTAGQEVRNLPVYKGQTNNVRVGVANDHYLTIPRGAAAALVQEITLPTHLVAPLTAGQQVGSLRVRDGDTVLAEYPLAVLDEVQQGSWWRRLIDTIRLWFA
ncbi:D-alanyl-D-alanine carboxypeptidase family protein [Candidatus Dactylopiibacterium carminicum]|uniref:D-alanyl-D-alanine carboxypeptidase family protein n=1 Tax=Candidatus Dactylopiibacterium carminicum TaxID=857335 RepID=UPI00114093D2|nr:D-alanyl-D-alanine carboxypeptidase family protein [Candidatus Dactylopiibacterium carminicum]